MTVNYTKTRLKGHESFIPREGWLTKGLMSVSNNPKVFSKFSGADDLGVGTNMAKSIHYWLRTSGLTADKQGKGVLLTELGKNILTYDPYMEDVFTVWIIHIRISCNYSQATSWNLFFNNISVSEFTRDELYQLMREKLMEVSGDTSPSERSLRDDCAAIISMYLEDEKADIDPEDKKNSPFSVLGLLESNGNKFKKSHTKISNIPPFAFLYLLKMHFDESAKTAGDIQGISIDEITDGYNMPGRLFNLNRIAVNQLLDLLEGMHFIIVNRTSGLDMVYPDEKLNDFDIIKQYYEYR